MEMLTSPYNLLDMLTLAHSLKMSSPGSLAVTASLHDLRVTLMSPPPLPGGHGLAPRPPDVILWVLIRPLCPGPVTSPVRALDHMLVGPEVPALQPRLLAPVDLPLYPDVMQTALGSFPIALSDVSLRNFPVTLQDVELHHPGLAHDELPHLAVRDDPRYPRGRAELEPVVQQTEQSPS